MSSSKENSVIALFASVRLALFLLFLLAVTSIIGTVIVQNAPPEYYTEHFGAKTAHFFAILDITDMYNSWWFLGLLALFALNLIVCSLQRIPKVIHFIRAYGLALSPSQLKHFKIRHSLKTVAPFEDTTKQVDTAFRSQGWKADSVDVDGGRMFFAQRKAWSRLGVYLVHLSILIILAGAVIGSPQVARTVLRNQHFAFKGNLVIPETEQNHAVMLRSGEQMNLDFALRCNDFSIEYYTNGMPKSYRSQITVIENEKPVRSADIEVNHPLTYKGITFYQSSYQPLEWFTLHLEKEDQDLQYEQIIPLKKEVQWQDAGMRIGLLNFKMQGNTVDSVKVWTADAAGHSEVFWAKLGEKRELVLGSSIYTIELEQLYATVLQVAKDPGIGLVYLGCLLMLLGLYVAFFLAHQRIFAFVEPTEEGCSILIAGDSNKNKVGFSRKFSDLISRLEK